ncbi:MAG TPA: CHASE3 domain-containing protein [Bryobacteraceae bacterium]|nr:CHASE3 domain-containing protein [Bryobacteraceae bacterium]
MKFRGRTLLALSAAGVIALLLFRVVERRTIKRERERVTAAQQSVRDTESILSAVLNAESGQRGYLLTGSPEYLSPYKDAVAEIPGLIAAIEQDSSGHPERERLTRELSSVVLAKLTELGETIELRSRGDWDGAVQKVRSNHGRDMMGRIRSLSKELRDNYFVAVNVQSRRVERYSFWGLILEISVGTLIFLLLCAETVQISSSFAAEERLIGEIRDKELRYKMLAAHIQSAREDERTALARDMHDDLGQALTGIKIDLAMLSRHLDGRQSHAAAERLNSSLSAVDAAIQSLRRFSRELRPAVLDQVGLGAALRAQGREFASRTGTRVELDIPDTTLPLTTEQRTALFRIAQEALTNVARHARAQCVRLSLETKNGDICLSIEDDGVGIASNPPGSRVSLGLLGMEERAQLVGATLKLSTERGKGTTVGVVLGRAKMESAQAVNAR